MAKSVFLHSNFRQSLKRHRMQEKMRWWLHFECARAGTLWQRQPGPHMEKNDSIFSVPCWVFCFLHWKVRMTLERSSFWIKILWELAVCDECMALFLPIFAKFKGGFTHRVLLVSYACILFFLFLYLSSTLLGCEGRMWIKENKFVYWNIVDQFSVIWKRYQRHYQQFEYWEATTFFTEKAIPECIVQVLWINLFK